MSKACGKCGGTMAVGVIVDNTSRAALQERWQEGEPKVSKWWGLRQDKPAQLDVKTWRCTQCGFLESYAIEDP